MQFLAGCLIGAAMGSATAFLLTPKRGRQIRDTLSQEARRLAAKAYPFVFNSNKWNDLAAMEEARYVINNLESIRSAGL